MSPDGMLHVRGRTRSAFSKEASIDAEGCRGLSVKRLPASVVALQSYTSVTVVPIQVQSLQSELIAALHMHLVEHALFRRPSHQVMS